jgi:dephospho-CoA kinase
VPADLRVGLTGGLASGKSTVARRMAAAGFHVVDADRLVAELYRPGGAGARQVERLFGPTAIAPDGSVDKVALARRIFSDREARERLEHAVHPLVRERFAEIAGALDGGVAVLEATRLVEAGYGPDFDLIVTVEAPLELRLARAVERGLTEPDARARLSAQGDGHLRRMAAHHILDNDGTLAELEAETDRLIRAFGREAEAP